MVFPSANPDFMGWVQNQLRGEEGDEGTLGPVGCPAVGHLFLWPGVTWALGQDFTQRCPCGLHNAKGSGEHREEKSAFENAVALFTTWTNISGIS